MTIKNPDKLIKKSNPNRHGFVKLWESRAVPRTYYLEDNVEEYEQDPVEYFDLNVALQAYNTLVKHYMDIPNWEAQAEYDDEFGPPLEQYPRPSEY